MIEMDVHHRVCIRFERLISECTVSQLNELIILADKELLRREKQESWAESFDTSSITVDIKELNQWTQKK